MCPVYDNFMNGNEFKDIHSKVSIAPDPVLIFMDDGLIFSCTFFGGILLYELEVNVVVVAIVS